MKRSLADGVEAGKLVTAEKNFKVIQPMISREIEVQKDDDALNKEEEPL